MKYLHSYKTSNEFYQAFYNEETSVVTAFTCSAGTFVYDREDSTIIQGQVLYLWVNGDKTLGTFARTPGIGMFDPTSQAGIMTGAIDISNETYVEITSVLSSTADPSTYYDEPYVSTVGQKRIQIKYVSGNAPEIASGETFWYDYVGEFDVYSADGQTFLYKRHVWEINGYPYVFYSESDTLAIDDTLQIGAFNTKYLLAPDVSYGVLNFEETTKVNFNKRITLRVLDKDNRTASAPFTYSKSFTCRPNISLDDLLASIQNKEYMPKTTGTITYYFLGGNVNDTTESMTTAFTTNKMFMSGTTTSAGTNPSFTLNPSFNQGVQPMYDLTNECFVTSNFATAYYANTEHTYLPDYETILVLVKYPTVYE